MPRTGQGLTEQLDSIEERRQERNRQARERRARIKAEREAEAVETVSKMDEDEFDAAVAAVGQHQEDVVIEAATMPSNVEMPSIVVITGVSFVQDLPEPSPRSKPGEGLPKAKVEPVEKESLERFYEVLKANPERWAIDLRQVPAGTRPAGWLTVPDGFESRQRNGINYTRKLEELEA
jgi:hypothetical protein